LHDLRVSFCLYLVLKYYYFYLYFGLCLTFFLTLVFPNIACCVLSLMYRIGKYQDAAVAKIETEEIRMKLQGTTVSTAAVDDIELLFARISDKRIFVTSLASKKSRCTAKAIAAASFTTTCSDKTTKTDCLAVEDVTCTVEAGGINAACAAVGSPTSNNCDGASTVNACAVTTGGTNVACAAANADKATCEGAAGSSGVNVCVFTPGVKCVFADAGSACNYIEADFFPATGTCKAKRTGTSFINLCKAQEATKGACLGVEDKTCVVKAGGTNAACAAANADKATCEGAAGSSGVNVCVFTNKEACDYIEPLNTGKIRLLPDYIATLPVSMSSSAEDKKYRFDDDAMFLAPGDKFKINEPKCSNSKFSTEKACTTKGSYTDVCIDPIDSKPYENGRETSKAACSGATCSNANNDAACREVDNPTSKSCSAAGTAAGVTCDFASDPANSWSPTGQCFKTKIGTKVTVDLAEGREDRQVDCEGAAGVWTAGSCSIEGYTSQEACETTGHWAYCFPNTLYTSSLACTRKGTWTPK
jgi:hypothetical protein